MTPIDKAEHVIERAYARYGLRLDLGDVKQLDNMLKNGKGWLQTRDLVKGVDIKTIKIHNTLIKVVWDYKNERLYTILPMSGFFQTAWDAMVAAHKASAKNNLG